jgi:hypothetical protein
MTSVIVQGEVYISVGILFVVVHEHETKPPMLHELGLLTPAVEVLTSAHIIWDFDRGLFFSHSDDIKPFKQGARMWAGFSCSC